ncbi:DUF1365 domain-containing protein [Roseospira marina]|uniref:DUF1365 domain-containing protein n=1 Tax=Roseospira marina TaxID=140057 RepID=A0A5M6I8I1_9PROT|nr:DUF1365 family protein [Roseospira marina]KAA5604560.1 DUF1365 domain-containing protein [Roseospira marina]MBB4315307.1 hypothetical protein [Roseospira marina]MBB5088306.1 hypothetical protein [Roseospira marina]
MTEPAFASALYMGTVIHRRLKPRHHRLRYRVFSLLLDLDELPRLDRTLPGFGHNRFAPVSFHDRDHGPGDGGSLRAWVEAELAAGGIDLGGGPIRVLSYPRLWGYAFNPLTEFFCYRPDGRLGAVLHEVNNTMGERHCYLIPVTDPPANRPGAAGVVVRQTCAKRFFVSPFIAMETTYHFKIRPPDDRVAVAIEQTDAEGPLLHAAFAGRRVPLSGRTLAGALARHPLMTLKVIVGIHWEALRLWLKGVRLVPRDPAPARLVTVVPPDGEAPPSCAGS